MDAFTWVERTIPGSDRPVTLTRLHVDGDGAYSALVRFPAGWSRPGLGHYDAAEEVLFLDGDFTMSGRRYGRDDYGWFPVGYRRQGSASSGGALALAWFSVANRWLTEPSPDEAAAEVGREEVHWPNVAPQPSPLGEGTGRLLRDGQRHAAWVVDTVPAGAVLDRAVQLYSLAQPAWAHVEVGEGLPHMDGPAFCRILA